MSEKNTQINRWVHLLKKEDKKINWTGKAIPLPLDTKITGPLKKETILGKRVITCKIDKQIFIIGDKFIAPSYKTIKTQKTNKNLQITTKQEIKKQINLKTLKNFELPYQGLKIELTGRLGGVNKTRKAKIIKGSLKPQSFNTKIQHTQKPIKTKWGLWGCTITMN